MNNGIELRRDYLLERFSIISHKRKLRPKEYKPGANTVNVSKCYFCPGNEEPELALGSINENGRWVVRWLKNKYPAFDADEKSVSWKEGFYFEAPGFGYHEVIIDTPKHGTKLFELSPKEIVRLLGVYRERCQTLANRPGIKYVVLFKNSGPNSGASIVHEHTQIIAQGFIPSLVLEKIDAVRRTKSEGCPYCKIIKQEAKSPRTILVDKNFVSFVPFAPRFAHEAWLFPRRHAQNLAELNDKELESLAAMLKHILKRVDKLADSFNLLFYYSPKKSDGLHFHVEITPRTSAWAGYEFASQDYIISSPPEESARFYRA